MSWIHGLGGSFSLRLTVIWLVLWTAPALAESFTDEDCADLGALHEATRVQLTILQGALNSTGHLDCCGTESMVYAGRQLVTYAATANSLFEHLKIVAGGARKLGEIGETAVGAEGALSGAFPVVGTVIAFALQVGTSILDGIDRLNNAQAFQRAKQQILDNGPLLLTRLRSSLLIQGAALESGKCEIDWRKYRQKRDQKDTQIEPDLIVPPRTPLEDLGYFVANHALFAADSVISLQGKNPISGLLSNHLCQRIEAEAFRAVAAQGTGGTAYELLPKPGKDFSSPALNNACDESLSDVASNLRISQTLAVTDKEKEVASVGLKLLDGNRKLLQHYCKIDLCQGCNDIDSPWIDRDIAWLRHGGSAPLMGAMKACESQFGLTPTRKFVRNYEQLEEHLRDEPNTRGICKLKIRCDAYRGKTELITYVSVPNISRKDCGLESEGEMWSAEQNPAIAPSLRLACLEHGNGFSEVHILPERKKVSEFEPALTDREQASGEAAVGRTRRKLENTYLPPYGCACDVHCVAKDEDEPDYLGHLFAAYRGDLDFHSCTARGFEERFDREGFCRPGWKASKPSCYPSSDGNATPYLKVGTKARKCPYEQDDSPHQPGGIISTDWGLGGSQKTYFSDFADYFACRRQRVSVNFCAEDTTRTYSPKLGGAAGYRFTCLNSDGTSEVRVSKAWSHEPSEATVVTSRRFDEQDSRAPTAAKGAH